MATKKKKPAKKTKKQKLQQEKMLYFFIGFAFVLIGLFGTLHLGFLGNLIANVFRVLVGNTYQLLGILMMFLGTAVMAKGKKISIKQPKRFIGGLLIYVAILVLLHARLFHNGITVDTNVLKVTWEKILYDVKMSTVKLSVGGGMIGALLYSGSYFLIDQFGTYLLVITIAVIGLLMLLDKSIEDVGHFVLSLKDVVTNWMAKGAEKQEERRQLKEERAAQRKEESRQQENTVRQMTEEEQLQQATFEIITNDEVKQTSLAIDAYQANLDTHAAGASEKASKEVTEEPEESPLDFDIPQEIENRDYHLPPTSLLDEIPMSDQSGEKERVQDNVEILERTFKSFGVDAKVVRASIGPSVTKYEIQPAVGVKVSKIVNLTDDLALALAAKDIRMEAPIPGKSLIGIEVPNAKISMVSFRDVVEAQTVEEDKLLEVPLGRDISGQVISADLTKMPHLLIAGSTGSGKSVCINGIITSVLMRAKPHEVKMMMIDPKMVELNVYNGVPHLLTPVVTNPRKAAQALQKVVQEMEKRYELFAGFGVRNITGYNELIIKHNMEDGENRPVLPFIVVIVDELADLMMVASNEVEDAITRLAQMARAAGIHMILATQRPSVDVITGIIKANVPSRIAFAVSSGTDSRTIIDSNGAEKLLGRGDMLFLPMGENKPIRVQGAFISDGEVENIVDFVTDQQQAEYQEEMMPTDEPTTATGESQDDLYQEAVEMIVEMETASISMLQRRFRIGYNRAARLIDEMEANGVVGPSEGSKPRKVLLSPMAISDESLVDEPHH